MRLVPNTRSRAKIHFTRSQNRAASSVATTAVERVNPRTESELRSRILRTESELRQRTSENESLKRSLSLLEEVQSNNDSIIKNGEEIILSLRKENKDLRRKLLLSRLWVRTWCDSPKRR